MAENPARGVLAIGSIICGLSATSAGIVTGDPALTMLGAGLFGAPRFVSGERRKWRVTREPGVKRYSREWPRQKDAGISIDPLDAWSHESARGLPNANLVASQLRNFVRENGQGLTVKGENYEDWQASYYIEEAVEAAVEGELPHPRDRDESHIRRQTPQERRTRLNQKVRDTLSEGKQVMADQERILSAEAMKAQVEQIAHYTRAVETLKADYSKAAERHARPSGVMVLPAGVEFYPVEPEYEAVHIEGQLEPVTYVRTR